MLNPKILLAIPTFNCEQQISRVLSKLSKNSINHVDKVIVIDNQSTDDSLNVAINTRSKFKLDKVSILKNTENYGLGGSHKVAFSYAKKHKFDFVVILHGDDQANPDEIPKLLACAKSNNNIDACLGSRFMIKSKLRGYSGKRIAGNLILNFIYSVVMLRLSKDLGSGLNIFKKTVYENERYKYFANDLTFNIDLLLFLYANNYKIKFQPISWSEDDQTSNAKLFNIGTLALIKLFRWRFNMPSKTKYADYTSEEF